MDKQNILNKIYKRRVGNQHSKDFWLEKYHNSIKDNEGIRIQDFAKKKYFSFVGKVEEDDAITKLLGGK